MSLRMQNPMKNVINPNIICQRRSLHFLPERIFLKRMFSLYLVPKNHLTELDLENWILYCPNVHFRSIENIFKLKSFTVCPSYTYIFMVSPI